MASEVLGLLPSCGARACEHHLGIPRSGPCLPSAGILLNSQGQLASNLSALEGMNWILVVVMNTQHPVGRRRPLGSHRPEADPAPQATGGSPRLTSVKQQRRQGAGGSQRGSCSARTGSPALELWRERILQAWALDGHPCPIFFPDQRQKQMTKGGRGQQGTLGSAWEHSPRANPFWLWSPPYTYFHYSTVLLSKGSHGRQSLGQK